MKFIIQIIFLILSCGILIAQSDERDYDEELRYQNDAINALKTEINQLRLKIKTVLFSSQKFFSCWYKNPQKIEGFHQDSIKPINLPHIKSGGFG